MLQEINQPLAVEESETSNPERFVFLSGEVI